jgi:molybdopterin molybdotransferase
VSTSPEISPVSCADPFDPLSLSCAEALARILAALTPVAGHECVALRAAFGRILASDVASAIDVPLATNSAVDGYAVRVADLGDAGMQLKIAGIALAGAPFHTRLAPGHCVRVMTGAVMPEGTDTVVMQEHAEVGDGRIRVTRGYRRGDNVRAAGEDLRRGQVALPAGRRLNAAELGLLASLGIGEVSVRRRLRVAFFSTGDELRSIGEPLAEGQVYDSNRYTLYGMLSALGAEVIDMGVVRDRPEAVRAAFEEAAACADVLITSGGVSVGEADYVRDALREIGQIEFWKVAMKPGRPFAFGRVRDAVFFGLPGNPVAVMVTFYQFVAPALRRLAGEARIEPLTVQARCTSRLNKKPGRTEYQRGVLEWDRDGALVVSRTGPQGSGILRSMTEANCFIVLAPERGPVEPGAIVEVQPFFGLV